MYENSTAAVQVYIERIAKLAQEIESEDTIDWGMTEIKEEDAYKLIAMSVVNQFDKYTVDEREIMIATITKLVVENFVLNIKLREIANGN
jgi:hypothetical protein